jgi:hypothetical protein
MEKNMLVWYFSVRIMLMEEEVKKSDENLAGTITKLAVTSKEADNILKKVRPIIGINC